MSSRVTDGLSDHFAINISVKVPLKEPCYFRFVRILKIHKINVQEFREDILHLDLIKCHHNTASLLSH